jgi:hypothetical protein
LESAVRKILLLLLVATTVFAHPPREYNHEPSTVYIEPIINRTDLINEGFENGFLPAGWASFSQGNTYQWSLTSENAHTGNNSAWVQYGAQGTSQNEWLVSPALDLSAIAQVYLEWYEDEAYWSGYGGHHYIMVSTGSQTNPADFSILSDMTPANHTVNSFNGDPVTLDLSSYAGSSEVYIAFRYTGVWADDWFVDDIRVYEPYAIDGAVTNISPDGMQYEDGDQITPIVTVANVGLSNFNSELTLNIIESGTIISTLTEQIGVLAPGSEVDVTFNNLILSSGHYYQLSASVEVDNDYNASNNNYTALINTYTEPHVPLAHFQTNAGCSPCVAANQTLDAYIQQVNDVSLLRIHTWWPGTDAIYDANISQNQELIGAYGPDYVPHMWVDGVVDLGTNSSSYVSNIDARKTLKSPLTFDLGWEQGNQRLRVGMTVVCPVPAGTDWRLKVALTEDNVYYAGANGETIHNQAFRRMYPSTDGMALDFVTGNYQFMIDCPLEGWDYNNLRATVYLQDADSWEIMQSATAFLSEIEYDPTAVNDLPGILQVRGAVPNPFNPSTEICFSIAEANFVEVTIYDSSGRVVREIGGQEMVAGDQSVTWDGRNDNGTLLASGVYYARVSAGTMSQTTKLVLAK